MSRRPFVMIINGSPSRNWNTDTLMKNALEGKGKVFLNR